MKSKELLLWVIVIASFILSSLAIFQPKISGMESQAGSPGAYHKFVCTRQAKKARTACIKASTTDVARVQCESDYTEAKAMCDSYVQQQEPPQN